MYTIKNYGSLGYQGKIIKVTNEKIALPNGKTSFREVVHHNGGVCILAIKDNKILFVRQFRYPYKEIVYELPAGKLELGEKPQNTALRELQEETGAIATKLYSLGKMYPSPGYTNEVIYLFYTDDYTIGNVQLDSDEFVEVVTLSLDETLQLISEGIIVDAKTIIAIFKYITKKS